MERTAGAIARWVAIGLAVLLSIVSLSPPPALPADAAPELASAGRAMALVAKLATLPHPRRTAEHDRVRDRVVAELAALGMSPIVSRTTGEDGHPIDNVLARRPGTRPGGRALMLAAHYDSVPAGPGAGDDAHGVAVILETLRALSKLPPLANDLIVLITDAEEEGLFGARAFVSAHPWAKDVSVVLNFEARGSTGPAAMFEVTRQNGFLVDALAQAGVRRPVATSLTGEVYRRMPNDTDLTVFARAGMAGMNFAFADGVARYHTARDRPEELDPRSVQHQLDYALPLVRALGAVDLATPRAPDRAYFAVGPWLVRYPARFALGLAVAVSGLFGLLLGADVRRGLVRVQDVALAAVAVLTFVLLGGAVGSLVERLAQLVARDPVRARGIDSLAPDLERLGLALAVVSVVGLALAELARRLPPAAVVRGALAPVALLALLVAFTAPGASHVLVWPVAAATAALALERGEAAPGGWRAITSGALAAVPAFFWAGLVQVLFIALGLAGAGLVGGVIAIGVAMITPAFLVALPAPRRVLATLAALGALLAVVGAISAARA